MKRLTLLLEGLVTAALLPGLTASRVSAVDLTGT
jgi:hypothetical protein